MIFKGITLFVNNIEDASKYYRNLFNVEPKTKDENSCLFILNSMSFFLHKKDSWEEGMPPNEDHFEFQVENVEDEIKRLESVGYKIFLEPKDYYWGKSAYLRDSENRLIEITQVQK